jgi:hypothetical protein
MKELAVASLIVLAVSAHADELYSNGPVVNAHGRSLLIKPYTAYGFAAQEVGDEAVADDFVVTGGGWHVTDLEFFSYQTGATSFGYVNVGWSIVSGDVNTGNVVASGTTAVTDGGLMGYRTTPGTLKNTDRAIYELKADIPDVSLSSGSYWLRWTIVGSSDFSGPWQPPTLSRSPGDAQQSSGGAPFATIHDGRRTVELPFVINGTVSAVPESSTVASLSAGLALLAFVGLRRRA